MTAFCTTVNKTDTTLASMLALVNDIRNKLNGSYIVSDPGLDIGTTNTAAATAAFDYTADSVRYSKSAVAAGTALGTDVIPQGLWGTVALDIGADGTIDIVPAPGNATGYDNALIALAATPAAASDHARVGFVSVSKSDGDFTYGTTALDAANVSTIYTRWRTAAEDMAAAVTE